MSCSSSVNRLYDFLVGRLVVFSSAAKATCRNRSERACPLAANGRGP
jgi:hypothetical protein